MPVLNQILDDLLDSMPNPPDHHPSVLVSLFASLFAGVPGGMNATGVGGVEGLVNCFRSQGLGHIAESWLSDEPDLPVTPAQLRRVLGDNRVQMMAANAGLTPEMLLGHLAQFLPGVVNHLAPQGGVPRPEGDPTLAHPPTH